MTDETPLTKAERKALKKEQKRLQRAQENQQKTVKKVVVTALIGIAVIFFGYFLWQSIVSIPKDEQNKAIDKVLQTDWYKGNKDAPVVIIEYSDFQCPACKAYQPVMEEVLAAYPDTVVLAYRHFPLKQVHLQAEKAAYAAEAAGKQGKFWEMHDLLFQNQETWAENRATKQIFSDYATNLNLNMDQFKRDVRSKEVKALVKADYMSGLQNAINSTPTFYINGERVVNPQGLDEFKKIIDPILINATASGQNAQ